MRELSLEHRILELHREARPAADSIFRRQGAAEHRVTRFQRIATHQILGMADGGDRTLRIELAVGPGAQHQALPVRPDLVVAPRFTRHGLGAELLGERYTDGFRFAVRVVRTQGHAQFTSLKKNELDFAAGIGTGDLNRAFMRKEIRMKARFRSHASLYSFIDRKSTRLNSSHITISYAVFCLKKKKKNKTKNYKKKKKKQTNTKKKIRDLI